MFYDDSMITGQTSILVYWHKGWLRWSYCFHVPSQSALDGETQSEREWGAVHVSLSQRTTCCAGSLMPSVQKAWMKLWGIWRCAWTRNSEKKGAADLGKDGAVGKEECGTDSAILVGRYPTVTLLWQSERKRAGGEIPSTPKSVSL